MDYQVKYKEALRAAEAAMRNTESAVTAGVLAEIFPEILESEKMKKSKDDKVIETLMSYFIDWSKYRTHFWGIPVRDVLEWLERHGKKKTALTDIEREDWR